MRIASNDNVIVSQLLAWYKSHKREMPWRNTRDPYKIWLSEVILQQTRVEQGMPYYLEFVQKYPSIKHLSEANIDEVLRLWQGLGYYSRARNLHKCAKTVSNELQGQFPQDRKKLQQLPGIGAYTSAAIASFAFGQREAVVDGNVIRVITRLFGIEDDISIPKTITKITQIAEKLIPAEQPGIFNHAIMEFGAIHCTPANPSCDHCVFETVCVARANGWQKRLPYKSKKIIKSTRYFHYLVLEVEGRFLMKKRERNDIWKGLFEFYLVETPGDVDIDQLSLPDELISNRKFWHIRAESKLQKHLLTHQNIMCRFYHIRFQASFKFKLSKWIGFQLYTPDEIEQLPKPILLDKYLGEKII